MKKAKVTVKGLGTLSLVLAITRFISDIQYNYPDFKAWVGGVMIVFVTMYVGAWLVTRGTTRN